MAASSGNCFICGKTAGKIAIKNHVLKEHNSGGELCYLLRAEGAYDKDYWLYFTVSLDSSLTDLDQFLRRIWCECCGHLSAFTVGRSKLGKARKMSAFNIKDTFLYEYDFGTTTEIILTVVDKISRPSRKEAVQLLARNIPMQEGCDVCGAPASLIDVYEGAIYYESCAEDLDDEEMFVPITNSPRSGECGYDGELDIWSIDLGKAFPQT
ncbi:MAG: hypothetical protein FWG10_07640 [Eubacteriaceae bacterium]|nr:hypothetical protein [Eubacteriaceae bacterium]